MRTLPSVSLPRLGLALAFERQAQGGTALDCFHSTLDRTRTTPARIKFTKNHVNLKPTTMSSPSNTSITEPVVEQSQPGPADGPKYDSSKPLDILFLQDATGSQGPYIDSARSAIQTICTKISASASLSQGALRFGLIAFRDHPPQDSTFVTKNFGFTSDVEKMTKNLAGLQASGGGDGPEASTAALADALNMEWDEDAVKIVVLITDAAPHGIGEPGDGFPNGSPDQNDPLEIVRQMAERGITLYVVACEPSLSTQYLHAVDFYRALCRITSGRMVPLLNAAQLGDYIVGSAVETVETEKLINEFQNTILDDIYGQGKPIEEVMQQIQAQMAERKTEIKTLNVEEVYEASAEADSNVGVWAQATSLGSARGRTTALSAPRLKAEYAPAPSASLGWASLSSASPSGGRSPRSRPASSVPAPLAAPSVPGGMMARERSALMTETSSYHASAPAFPRAQAPQQAAPAVSLASQAIDESQTKRIIMQTLMRNAKVGPGGVLTPTGEYSGAKGVKILEGVPLAREEDKD